jgi:hypothetical protein
MGSTPAERDWIAENENIFIAIDRNDSKRLGIVKLILSKSLERKRSRRWSKVSTKNNN